MVAILTVLFCITPNSLGGCDVRRKENIWKAEYVAHIALYCVDVPYSTAQHHIWCEVKER